MSACWLLIQQCCCGLKCGGCGYCVYLTVEWQILILPVGASQPRVDSAAMWLDYYILIFCVWCCKPLAGTVLWLSSESYTVTFKYLCFGDFMAIYFCLYLFILGELIWKFSCVCGYCIKVTRICVQGWKRAPCVWNWLWSLSDLHVFIWVLCVLDFECVLLYIQYIRILC